jgi:hypothetical protein
MIQSKDRVLDYFDPGVPESRVWRFFRRDLPLAIVVVLLLLLTTFLVWAMTMAGADGR